MKELVVLSVWVIWVAGTLVGIQQELTDTTVERANFDVRVEAFKSMVSKLDKELKDANTRG